MDLIGRIKNRQAQVSILGLGYVGLPLAVAFAEAGFRVIGLDIDENKLAELSKGRSYLADVSSERVFQLTCAGQRLLPTNDYTMLSEADVVIVCVPTPLSKTRDPDLSYVIMATEEISRRIHPQQLIIMESTNYPGSTEEVVLPRLSKSGLKVGKDFFLAFSPERADPGQEVWKLKNTPKVIGGVTSSCLRVANEIYLCITDTVVSVSSVRTAEMVKLLENTFRAVNIGLVNEVAIMCDHLGIEVWEVVEAAATKPFGFMPFKPGPGLGGHCIPIDPEYLAWKLRTLNYTARFIELASEINRGMPRYVLGKIVDALNCSKKPVNGSNVLILGVTYKANVNDIRESPALDLISLLGERGANVAYHDPYISSLQVEGLSLNSMKLDEEQLQQSDCVVIVTDHRAYDWQWILDNSQLIVDTRNATKGLNTSKTQVVKL